MANATMTEKRDNITATEGITMEKLDCVVVGAGKFSILPLRPHLVQYHIPVAPDRAHVGDRDRIIDPAASQDGTD